MKITSNRSRGETEKGDSVTQLQGIHTPVRVYSQHSCNISGLLGYLPWVWLAMSEGPHLTCHPHLGPLVFCTARCPTPGKATLQRS